MDSISSFEDLFESILVYRKIVLLVLLIKNNVDLITEFGYLQNDNYHLCSEF